MTEPTKEQIAEAKERRREIALKNLNEKALQNLALAYFVNESKDFGEADNSVIEQYKYMPAIKGSKRYYNPETGQEGDLVVNSLFGSRQGEKRYTGNVSEFKIIQDASSVIQESLANIKVGDILKLVGSKVKSSHANAYLADLMQSGKEGEEMAQKVMGAYLAYFTSNGMSDAYSQRAGDVRKSLETILAGSDKAVEKRR